MPNEVFRRIPEDKYLRIHRRLVRAGISPDTVELVIEHIADELVSPPLHEHERLRRRCRWGTAAFAGLAAGIVILLFP